MTKPDAYDFHRDCAYFEQCKNLRDYWKALTDRKFLKANYGIRDIDIQFLYAFAPEHVVRDWREWRGKADGPEQTEE